MADLFRLFASAVPVSSDVPKSLIDLGQDGTGTSVVRVYRMWQFGSFQDSVGGATFVNFTIARTTPTRDRSNLTAVPAKTISVLPREVNMGSRRNPVHGSVFRQYIRDRDAWAPGVDDIRHWQFDVPMAEVWEAGYCDSNIQPITLRAGQGVHIRQETAGSILVMTDFELEFTIGST